MIKNQLKYLYLLFLFCAFSASAQINSESKRANHWYFGQGAGIDWSSGSPVAVSNGQTNSFEGAASICDLNGNLLFYSDGNTIWNKNHVPMQGGFNLLGCNSFSVPVQVSQNAAIVPKPGNDSIYYLFSLGCLDFQGYNFNYTTINIKLNTGLGKVITANTFLMRSRTQGIGVCRASNGCDTWVVAMDSLGYNCFYKVTAAGVSNTAVKQFGGITYFPNGGTYCNYKFSNDLKLMANNIYTGYSYDTLVIHQFNNTTAATTNPVRVPTKNQTVCSVAFSPDNKKLYTTMPFNANGGSSLDTLYQYNLNVYNESAIRASKTIIYADSVATYQLQNAPNGKIYITRLITYYSRADIGDSLAVINNPNASGVACGFSLNAVYLNGKKSMGSIPNFDQAYFYPLLNNTCITGIEEININHFKIYPNPANDFVNITNSEGFDFELLVFSVNGSLIKTDFIRSFENKKINITSLINGIYILQLKNSNKVLNYKLIKN